jgi:hypothetical protein
MLIDNGNEDDEKCFNNPTEYLKVSRLDNVNIKPPCHSKTTLKIKKKRKNQH